MSEGPDDTGPTETVQFEYRHAAYLAVALCGLLTLVSFFFPPGLNFDPGMGMLEWRTLVEGGPANSIVAPDPADIAKDRVEFVTWWSPGQYVIPGVFTALGLKLGPALSLTAGLCLLSCLLGWIRVLKHFDVSAQTTVLMVAFLSVFSYSTINFRIYYGGEILLQAIVPWLVLAGCRVPIAGALEAAGLAGLAILVGFFAKLTGVLVAVAALAAGSLVALMRLRRLTAGMLAGAAGAVAAVGILYAEWFSRGPTAASGSGWTLDFTKAVFSAAAPWGAGVSWMDMWEWVWLREPSLIVWILLPPVLFFAFVLIHGSQRKTGGFSWPSEFTNFTLFFYAVYTVAMEGLFMHGGPVIEERHFRSAGTLIFVGALGVADHLPRTSAVRFAVITFCTLMSLYGVFSFIDRVGSVNPAAIDRYSWTRQFKVDARALAYARAAFAREGRDALFVIPFPDAASAFPLGARLSLAYLEVQSEEYVATRQYGGTVRGHVYVIIQSRVARTLKGGLLLQEFKDYPLDTWEGHEFGSTTVFVHSPPAT